MDFLDALFSLFPFFFLCNDETEKSRLRDYTERHDSEVWLAGR